MDKNIGGCGENRNICCGCGQRQSERRKRRGGEYNSEMSLVLIMGGRPSERRRWAMNGYITGSVDVETCVITKTRFRTLDPLLVYSPFNRSTFHVK